MHRKMNRIFVVGVCFILSSAEPAAENFYAFGFLDIFRELVFVLPRVGYAFAFLWTIRIERFDTRADKVRTGAGQRGLNLVTKRCHVFDGADTRDATPFGYGL